MESISENMKCSKCDKFAAYNCTSCGRPFCGDHVDDHSEVDGK